MVAKNSSKQEALRIRVYKFFEAKKELGKIYTVNHFTAEKVPRSTVYRILSPMNVYRQLGSKVVVQHTKK